ncbi:MAG: isopentenyl phosphate kinase [Candidatus Nanohaloarchaea archaeon]
MDYVLKLGGSVLTDKTSENTLSKNFSQVLSEIELGGILVHGAGSFGHPQAERKGLRDGTRKGYLEPHTAVKKLNGKIVEELRKQDLEPMPAHTSSIAYRENGETRLQLGTVRKAAERGFLPVLHGDMILEENGFSVISGDELVAMIEKRFSTGNAGFCISEEGVLNREAEVVERISSLKELHSMENDCADVTGGIEGKVQEVLEKKVRARIFGREELKSFFRGQNPGTLVEPSETI